jgi:hypothetical protein
MQNAEFAEKTSKNAFKPKEYIYPSGRLIKVQGYEPFALNELLGNGTNEDDIITSKFDVPEIWYIDSEGKTRRYYVDIFLPKQNKCIEVKSTWTAEKNKDIIFLKKKAVVYAGYECEIWVYNKNREKIVM